MNSYNITLSYQDRNGSPESRTVKVDASSIAGAIGNDYCKTRIIGSRPQCCFAAARMTYQCNFLGVYVFILFKIIHHNARHYG